MTTTSARPFTAVSSTRSSPGSDSTGRHRYEIQGDPGRPARPALTPDDGAPDGEVALLSFPSNDAEAAGIATLVEQLVAEAVPPNQILVLFRGDYNGHFSAPVKDQLTGRGIAVSDPDVVDRALSEDNNRRSLEMLRLAVSAEDSLAWAAIMHLTPNVGDRFFDHIYGVAVPARLGFGGTLLRDYENGFQGAPRPSAGRAAEAMRAVQEWIDDHPISDEPPLGGWGHWITGIATSDIFPGFDDDLAEIIQAIDTVAEPE